MKEKLAIQEAFSELSPKYEEVVDGELKLFWGWSYQAFVEELVRQTDLKTGQAVLDIATGTSIIPRRILQRNLPGIAVTGLDITEKMLRQGKAKIQAEGFQGSIHLSCGDAMALPFRENSFDVVVSGLASHHMDIPLMISEIKRVLKPGGLLSVIDVGTSPFWELPIMKFFARLIAFFYFLVKENPSRAWAEAAAVRNLRTPEGWQIDLRNAGFTTVRIKKLTATHRWTPEPLSIQSSYEEEKR